MSIRAARERGRRETFARLERKYRAGEYEEVEAEARALAAASRRHSRRRRPLPQWQARVLATGVAVAHGRGTEVLPELEALIDELEPVDPEAHVLRLIVRNNRVTVLNGQERYEDAETEALGILRDVTRLAHLTPLWRMELSALGALAVALCGQDRHEEAEAIARGNLPRAAEPALAGLHAVLVRSLNGQGRHEEALAEARRDPPHQDRRDSGLLDLVTAEALHGLGRRGEAEAAVRRALADCERHLHPAHPRIREARTLLGRVTGEGPGD
ncbi:tetratricopeptide repeat protein [Streptomyces sp. AC627_RSS907]|uniref:tetratricopeptide repeat protein n=1 Tax=Streptomyces sp. AC627_RSS907 TaxID=2823684 RepID=UPI0020B88042|nr:tetratricopeptide repeat protein [Streptomyces sp. AC627_RSS907]